MSISLVKLTDVGQIQKGDALVYVHDGKPKSAMARDVLNAGSEYEEVVTNRRLNNYFITRMAINGKSWAKDVTLVRTSE